MRNPWIVKWKCKYGYREWEWIDMPDYFPVSIYADTTGQYTNEECDRDNVVEIPVPRDLLWKWWVECLEFDREQCQEYEPEDGWDEPTKEDLIKWVYHESTCDDTKSLYDWLVAHNYTWKRID